MRKVKFNNGNIEIDILKDLILRDRKEFETSFSIAIEKPFNIQDFLNIEDENSLPNLVKKVSKDAVAIDGIENDLISLIPFHVHFDILYNPSDNDISKLEINKENYLTIHNCVVIDISIKFNLKKMNNLYSKS